MWQAQNKVDQLNELMGRQSFQSLDLSAVCVVEMVSVLLTLRPEEGALRLMCRIGMTAAT